ncbi:hypothetical protein MNB_SV-8-274 [hydrothermal vent metagenome]|uniref:DUF3144 domain-containing protein n=1 Tax=hydrothermal vent metagenome TaxID=652676 RepID=A0A1W1C0H4_9ZZZZ
MSYTQEQDLDEKFFERADAHIKLANEYMNQQENAEMVNNSFLYAAARFNAWISAAGLKDAEAMKAKRADLIRYFVEQYTSMLEENLDNYIDNYDLYLGISKEEK